MNPSDSIIWTIPIIHSIDSHFVVVESTIVGMVERKGRRKFSAVHFSTGKKLGHFESAAAAEEAVIAAETEANQ